MQPRCDNTCLLAVISLLVGMIPSYACADERPLSALDEVAFDPRIGDMLPLSATFTDSSGQDVTLEECMGDKPVVLMPVYYRCPMLCGLELNGLVSCLRAMDMSVGEEFDVITYSIDPREGADLAAEKKSAYVAQYGRASAASGWRFLTGDEESIQQLSDAIGFHAVYNDETGEYAHAAGIVVITPQGRISRYFFGVEFAPRSMRLALVEASQGKLGTMTDHVLLFCYAYDPTTGKYGLAILNIIRAAGLLTVLTMAVGIGWLLRRERLRRQQTEVNASERSLSREGAAS